MNTKVEVKALAIDQREIAFQSHEEATGFAGTPRIERQHFDSQKTAAVFVSLDEEFNRTKIEEPEPKLKPVIVDGNVESGFFAFDSLNRNTDYRRRSLISDLQQIVAVRTQKRSK